MDEGRFSVSADSLYHRARHRRRAVLIDVRRRPAFDDDEWMIVGAIRRPPEFDRRLGGRRCRMGRPVVVYCVHGQEVSRNAAAALRGIGIDARYLEGGIAGWAERKLPLRKKVPLGDRRLGHARAPEDRPHRLPVADPPLHRS